MKKILKPTNVDAYIAAAPKEVQSKLQELRAAIKAAAPKAEEKISYGMPYYGYKGRLAYFAYAKHHIGLYAMPPIVKDHAKELRKYKTATATIRFPLNEKLPIALKKNSFAWAFGITKGGQKRKNRIRRECLPVTLAEAMEVRLGGF